MILVNFGNYNTNVTYYYIKLSVMGGSPDFFSALKFKLFQGFINQKIEDKPKIKIESLGQDKSENNILSFAAFLKLIIEQRNKNSTFSRYFIL